MGLCKSGKLLCDLRKAKGMTQKELAGKLGVVPKTVSKWETGHGFPDISTVSALADILGVSERTVLSGNMKENPEEAGNMKRIKFYVCPQCGSFMQGTGNGQIVCCGKQIEQLQAKETDGEHDVRISVIEDDFYIETNHEMKKEHYLGFVAYVMPDRVLTVRLYPEQDAAVRMPAMYGGALYVYCNKHGLFKCRSKLRRNAGL